MGLSEHALQYHMSDWSSCAIWDPYVARDPNPTRMAVSGEKNGFGTKNRVSAFKIAICSSFTNSEIFSWRLKLKADGKNTV